MFEQASRSKFRFNSSQGLLTTEDLWDLPLTSTRYANLNDIAKELNRTLKATAEEDFVGQGAARRGDDILQLKFAVVKRIIEVRLAEVEVAKQAADKRARKERLLEIIAGKQDEQLKGASLDELQKMVAEL